MTNLLLGLGGAIVLCDLIKPLVGRARPQIGAIVAVAPGYAFPSAHTTQTTAVAVTLAMLSAAAMDRWSRKVAVWCAAGRLIGTHKAVTETLERVEHWLVPVVFIVLGLFILIESGVIVRLFEALA